MRWGPAVLCLARLVVQQCSCTWGRVLGRYCTVSVQVSTVCTASCACRHRLQYAALATQIGTIQQAEAPRRTIKAVSPAIRKVKRKAALPPEARRGAQGGRWG